jgi:hypothetical protein
MSASLPDLELAAHRQFPGLFGRVNGVINALPCHFLLIAASERISGMIVMFLISCMPDIQFTHLSPISNRYPFYPFSPFSLALRVPFDLISPSMHSWEISS